MLRALLLSLSLLVLNSPNPLAAADPVPKIAEGKKELARLEDDLAKLNAERPAEVGEWVWAGDLKVRVTGAELREVKTTDIFGKETTSAEKELVVRVEAATIAKARRVFYQRPWDKQAHRLLDDRGTEYELSPYGLAGNQTLDPGAPAFKDEFHFKRPGDKVQELRLTLTGLLRGGGEEYRFRIPSSAWVVDLAGTVKRLEKVAGAAPDAGDKQKLRDAIAVLKKLEVPPPTEAQKERAKRSEGLATRIAAKRDEIVGLELTAGEFAGLNEWVQVGDVRVRVTKVWLRDRIVVNSPTVKYGPASPWLVMRVEIENRSKTKAAAYTRWSSHREARYVDRVPPLAGLTDRHDNRYPSQDYFAGVIEGMKEGVAKGQTEIAAGASAVDLVCFEEPLTLSGDLLLTLDPVQDGEKGAYRFKIPAADWKPKK